MVIRIIAFLSFAPFIVGSGGEANGSILMICPLESPALKRAGHFASVIISGRNFAPEVAGELVPCVGELDQARAPKAGDDDEIVRQSGDVLISDHGVLHSGRFIHYSATSLVVEEEVKLEVVSDVVLVPVVLSDVHSA